MTEKLGLVCKQESKLSALRYAIGYILGKKKKTKQRTRKELKVISRKVNIMLTYSTSPRVSEDQKRTVKPRGDTGGQDFSVLLSGM